MSERANQLVPQSNFWKNITSTTTEPKTNIFSIHSSSKGINVQLTYQLTLLIFFDLLLTSSIDRKLALLSQQTQPPKPSTTPPVSVDSDYVSHMRHMLSDATFSDVTFHIDTHEFTAHRSIIAARCAFFTKTFTGQTAFLLCHLNLRLDDIQASNKSKVSLKEITPGTFEGKHSCSTVV